MLGSLFLLSMSCLWLLFCFQAPAPQSSSGYLRRLGTYKQKINLSCAREVKLPIDGRNSAPKRRAHLISNCSVLSMAPLEIRKSKAKNGKKTK